MPMQSHHFRSGVVGPVISRWCSTASRSIRSIAGFGCIPTRITISPLGTSRSAAWRRAFIPALLSSAMSVSAALPARSTSSGIDFPVGSTVVSTCTITPSKNWDSSGLAVGNGQCHFAIETTSDIWPAARPHSRSARYSITASMGANVDSALAALPWSLKILGDKLASSSRFSLRNSSTLRLASAVRRCASLIRASASFIAASAVSDLSFSCPISTSLSLSSVASCRSLAWINSDCASLVCPIRFKAITVVNTTNMAAIAPSTKAQTILSFHQSVDWLKRRTRSVRAWISDTFSPSEVAGLAIILLCCCGMIGIAANHSLWYRRRYCNTKTIDKP
jgi:hypothetical protein